MLGILPNPVEYQRTFIQWRMENTMVYSNLSIDVYSISSTYYQMENDIQCFFGI